MNNGRIIVLLMVVVCSLVLGGCSYQATWPVKVSTPLPTGYQLEMDIQRGSITLLGTDEETCHVYAFIHASSSMKHVHKVANEGILVELVQVGDKIQVQVREPFKGDIRYTYYIDYIVTAPRKTNLQIRTHDGDLKAIEFDGEHFRLEAPNGEAVVYKMGGTGRVRDNRGTLNSSG
jgi:hypothetical protein